MKKLLLTGACVLIFAFAAAAQAPTPFTLYAGGALSLPNAPDGFKEAFKTGYHGLIGAGYKVGPNFQLVGKIEYHKFSFDFGYFGVSGASGGDTKMWLYGADGRYALGLPAAPIKPFFFGGLGLANVKQSEFGGSLSLITSLNSSYSESQNKLYYNIGGGVEFGSSPTFGFFAQIRYVSIATEGSSTSFVPITVGVKFL